MKTGDRVCATISLHRSGVPISGGDCGVVVAVKKGKIVRRKTGFGVEKHRTSDRVQVQWDKGPMGWHDAEVLEGKNMSANPVEKISSRDPKTMTASEINRELDSLDKKRSKLNDEFIDAGRGHETVNETWKLNDPLAVRYKALSNRHGDLQREIHARYGPGAPSRLPTRGFGPRTSNYQANPRRKLSKKCQGIVSRVAASEQRKGVPQKQAVAIGYSKARRAGCRVPPPPRALAENPGSFWKKFSG